MGKSNQHYSLLLRSGAEWALLKIVLDVVLKRLFVAGVNSIQQNGVEFEKNQKRGKEQMIIRKVCVSLWCIYIVLSRILVEQCRERS